jgi:hypothetical protein
MRAAVALAALLLGACAANPEHENFKRVMEHQVGKSIDDADAYPVFYRLRQTSSKSLPNGNLQQQYAAGRNGRCELSFEVEPLTRRIVRWSLDGGERECVIPTRSGS